MIGGTDRDVRGTAAAAAEHLDALATTYDGTCLRLYVNGVAGRRSSLATGSIVTSTGALKIGGNAIWGEWFHGLIDEVRVYNRALTRRRDPGGHDTADHATRTRRRRRRPATLDGDRRADARRAQLGRGDRQRRRRPLQRPSRHDRRLHAVRPRTGSRSRRARRYTDTVAAGTYYYRVTAEDAAGNVGPASNEVSVDVGDIDGAVRAGHADRSRRRRQGDARPGARRPTTSASPATTSSRHDARLHAHRREPDRAADGHRATRTPSAPARTSTGSPPRTRPATSAPPRTRRAATVTADTTAPSAAGRACRLGRRQHRQPELDGLDRRRRRRPLQRPPRHQRRLHAERREPDRPADRHQLRRHRARDRHLLLQGHRRGRRRQHQRRLERGDRDRRRRDGADRARARSTAASRAAPSTSAWGAATDNVGVVRYNVHRGTTSGFTPAAPPTGSRSRPGSATPTPASPAGTLLLQGHRRGRGRQHRPRLQHRQRDRRRHDRAERAGKPRRDRRRRPGASPGPPDGQRRRHPLQRPPLDHARLHAERGEPDRAADRHELHGHRPRRRHLLLQGDRRGRGRERQRPPRTRRPRP